MLTSFLYITWNLFWKQNMTENTRMVEMVLLDLPCFMDLVWIGGFPIWRWHGQTWKWSKDWWICEELFWVWTWFSRSSCNCGGWFLSVVCTYLRLWNQSIQLSKTMKSSQCFSIQSFYASIWSIESMFSNLSQNNLYEKRLLVTAELNFAIPL